MLQTSCNKPKKGVKLNKPLHKIHQNLKNHIYNIAIMEGERTKCTSIQST
jgi:hypothetical protein